MLTNCWAFHTVYRPHVSLTEGPPQAVVLTVVAVGENLAVMLYHFLQLVLIVVVIVDGDFAGNFMSSVVVSSHKNTFCPNQQKVFLCFNMLIS
jgi:hypothetical protein